MENVGYKKGGKAELLERKLLPMFCERSMENIRASVVFYQKRFEKTLQGELQKALHGDFLRCLLIIGYLNLLHI